MKKSKPLSKIEKDLAYLKNFWTVLFGSYVSNDWIPGRSDIDVAIITRTKDRQKNLEIWSSMLEKQHHHDYDLRIFELMPLYLQIEIIKNYKVLFGDPLEISEYFYHYRKLWKDMEYHYESNQFKSLEEKLKLMENRKNFI